MPWLTYAESHIGGREEQQDRYLLVESADRKNQLLVVADGAGGHNLGAAAAQAAIDCIREYLGELWLCTDPGSVLHKLIMQCNERVLKVGDSDMACSTLVLVLIRGDELFWGHVGDSRLYLVRDAEIAMQTQDHSLAVLQQHDSKQNTPLNGATANGLYMCLGAMSEITPEISSSVAKANDTLLLCSDGLWGQLDMQWLVAKVSEQPPNKELLTEWVNQARRAKDTGSDNITLVVAHFVNETPFWRSPFKAMMNRFS